jgi:hypothetical protein
MGSRLLLALRAEAATSAFEGGWAAFTIPSVPDHAVAVVE